MKNIGKVIYNKLNSLFENRCYPIVAEETTKMPFAVYQRESTSLANTKDGYICDESHSVQINIVTEKYDEGIELMQNVVEIFEGLEGEISDIEVVDTQIDSVSETYSGAYIQTINLTIKTN